MKKNIILLISIIIVFFACNKVTSDIDMQYNARIVGFDLNCSTCIIEFPYNTVEIKNNIGESQSNYYQTVNLNKDNFRIGQNILVSIRKPENNELKDCITLYPSYNYTNVYVINYEYQDNLIFNDTVTIPYHHCLSDSVTNFTICFDSVLNDSRCPTGAQCLWEGSASVRFRIDSENNISYVDLLTHPAFLKDTVINGYKISLISLMPYPVIDNQLGNKKYKAQIVVNHQ